jgi:hypothetical protein
MRCACMQCHHAAGISLLHLCDLCAQSTHRDVNWHICMATRYACGIGAAVSLLGMIECVALQVKKSLNRIKQVMSERLKEHDDPLVRKELHNFINAL